MARCVRKNVAASAGGKTIPRLVSTNPPMTARDKIAGVTAGASTPEWIVQDFVERLREV